VKPEDLKRFALFAELSEEEREVVCELLEERKLADSKTVFRERAEADGLVLLASGRVRLESRRADGPIDYVDAPEHLGALSLFVLGRREVTAISEGASTVWLLPRSAMSRLLEDAPRAAYRLAEAVVDGLAGALREHLDPLVEFGLD
jgi:CRP-like cAMP-binding protein